MTPEKRPGLYTRYPLTHMLIYNGATAGHYVLGGAGLALGYGYWAGYLAGLVYLVLSFGEMYLHMPLKVCPNCVYYRLKNSLCVSGLNILSRKIAGPGKIDEFSSRARGALCPNNLYIAALAVPIIGIIPALVINFSVPVLVILLILVGLLLFRFFVIFPRIACVHCRAQNICPQARSMGFGKE